MTQSPKKKGVIQSGMLHSSVEMLVGRIIQSIGKSELGELKEEFHNQLGITQSHPDNTELIEDLWDFFYDWCLFERSLVDRIRSFTPDEQVIWDNLKKSCVRSLFSVAKTSDDFLKLKDLYGRKAYVIQKKSANDLIGLSKGDLIECRLLEVGEAKKKEFNFLRKPSYHPAEIHGYIKKKLRQYRKSKNVDEFQDWLWVLAGMHLKHRFYPQMPIDKIYDDNSRI